MNAPKRFRKKPVTVEAVQITDDLDQALATADWCGGMLVASPGRSSLHIPTLEGTMVACPGDWVIKGVAGEFDPCRGDIFAATYDEVTE